MGNPRGVSRDFEALEARRTKAVALFREKLNNSEIGRQLQVANQTVSRWRKEYQEGGKKALRARCHNLDGFSVLEVYPGIRGCTGPNRHGARSLFSGCRAAGESIPFGCRLPPFMQSLARRGDQVTYKHASAFSDSRDRLRPERLPNLVLVRTTAPQLSNTHGTVLPRDLEPYVELYGNAVG